MEKIISLPYYGIIKLKKKQGFFFLQDHYSKQKYQDLLFPEDSTFELVGIKIIFLLLCTSNRVLS